MTENGMLTLPRAPETLAQTREALDRMLKILSSMAETTRATNERMAALEETVRRLEKATPAEAAALNAAVRKRAKELCAAWRAEGQEKAAAALIRKGLRAQTGARTAREIPRCDLGAAMLYAESWEDVAAMRRLREEARE